MKRFIVLCLLAFGISFSNISFAYTVADDDKTSIVIAEDVDVGLDILHSADNLTVDLHVDPGGSAIHTNTKAVFAKQIAFEMLAALMYRHRLLYFNRITKDNDSDSVIHWRRPREGVLSIGNSMSYS